MSRVAAASLSTGEYVAYGGSSGCPSDDTSTAMLVRRASALALRAARFSSASTLRSYHEPGAVAAAACGTSACSNTNKNASKSSIMPGQGEQAFGLGA
jgi:hypothetical protein